MSDKSDIGETHLILALNKMTNLNWDSRATRASQYP